MMPTDLVYLRPCARAENCTLTEELMQQNGRLLEFDLAGSNGAW